MEFRLPSNLQQELLAYDPALKKQARETKQATKKSSKPKYPLGNVNDLIPFHIISPNRQQEASDFINSHTAEHRIYRFTRIENIDKNGLLQPEEVVHALIYHFESLWVAVWLPAPGEDYIYGYAHAYKDTVTARNMIAQYRINVQTDNNHQILQYGRSHFHVCRQLITHDYLKEMRSEKLWSVPQSWGKGANIYAQTQRFEQALYCTIPTWTDASSIFDRIRCKSIADALTINKTDLEMFNVTGPDWRPSFETIVSIISNVDGYNYTETSAYIDRYRGLRNVLPIINKPFMRRWIQERLDEAVYHYQDPKNQLRKRIVQPWNQILQYLVHISKILRIWPDCPIDYYQTYQTELICVDPCCTYDTYGQLGQWLHSNMPVASYFNILRKFYEQQEVEHNNSHYCKHISEANGLPIYRMYEWRDTLNMLDNLLTHGKTVEPPKRWRLTEFHDELQAEAWKIKNPKASLPQDLFPEPVRVQLDGSNWSFFQPSDTHQLSSWGQAARNCVGNATSYAEGVRKKKHFIVLCMLDGKPQFTVQLDVNNGMMNVKQIVGLSNARLTAEQKQQYTEAFGMALQQRNDTLESV